MTDRNAPCPCGSGKKYKKCHMLLEEVDPSSSARDVRYEAFRAMRNEADEKVLELVRRLIPDEEGFRFARQYFPPPILTPEDAGILKKNPDFLHHFELHTSFALLRAFRTPEGKSLHSLALARFQSRFSPEQVEFLRADAGSPVTFIQLREFFPGEAYVIAEDIFDGEIYRVYDYSIARNPQPHAILAGRLLRYPHGQGYVLDPLGQVAYEPGERDDLILALADMAGNPGLRGKALKQAIHAKPLLCFWAGQWRYHRWLNRPKPKITTRDGDPFVSIEAKWSVADPNEVLARMRKWRGVEEETVEGKVEFTWLEKDGTLIGVVILDDKRRTLELITHSERRYGRWMRKIHRLPGLDFLERKDRSPSADAEGEFEDEFEPSDADDEDSENFPPEVMEKIGRESFAKWMKETLDSPVPALGDLSPRDCCKSPEGRRKVRAWIDDYEARLAMNPRDPIMRHFDMDEVRKRLGLD